jgi:signal transduction histidine kinase/CheY-like chemotaxis protein
MLQWAQRLSVSRVRRGLLWAAAFICLCLIAWAGGEAWRFAALRAGSAGAAGRPTLSALFELMAPLGVALGLWGIALWVAWQGRPAPAFYFLLGAAVLATGLLSGLESDRGSRLFYFLLAWFAPTIFFLHYELIARPPGRVGRAAFASFILGAMLLSLPPLLWTRADLDAMAWGPLWRSLTRLNVLCAVVASGILVAWNARRNWAEARRRPIRLILFGNIASVMPLLLLSVLPQMLAFPFVQYEYTMLCLLISPLFYAYSLIPSQLRAINVTEQRISTYYAIILSISFLFIILMAFLYRVSSNPLRDWPVVGVLFGTGAVLLAALLRQPLERFTDWVWFGANPAYRLQTSRLIESLAITLDRESLQRLLVPELAQVMRLSWSALYYRDASQTLRLLSSYGLEERVGPPSILPESGGLMAHLAACSEPVAHPQLVAALGNGPLGQGEQHLLALTDTAFWLPLLAQGKLQGLLIVGQKMEDDLFTVEDSRILASLGHQAGIAAHNVRLGEQKAMMEAQLLQSQKMEAIGRLAAGIAHDFNNILTSIIGFSELLQVHQEMPADARAELQLISQGGHRAAGLVRQILDFSRKSMMQRQPLDLFSFVKDTMRFLRRTIPENVRVSLEADPEEYVISSDPTMLQQVLTNLAVNACDAMPQGGALRFRLSTLVLGTSDLSPLPDMRPGRWIVLSVADTGAGIPDDALPHLFEPFFTTKEVGKGTGLGLAQVYGIVKQHEGHIAVQAEQDKGSTFTLYLPALAAREASPEAEPQQAPLGHGETVLVVEDEPSVLGTLRRMLEQANFRVLAAGDAQQALTVYQQHRDEVAVVLTDMVMPVMSGRELIQALRALDPEVKAVVVSGYPLDDREQRFLSTGSVEWIQKPVTSARLARVLNGILAAHSPAALDLSDMS